MIYLCFTSKRSTFLKDKQLDSFRFVAVNPEVNWHHDSLTAALKKSSDGLFYIKMQIPTDLQTAWLNTRYIPLQIDISQKKYNPSSIFPHSARLIKLIKTKTKYII